MKLLQRIFYINVGNMHPDDVSSYLDTVKKGLFPNGDEEISGVRVTNFFIACREFPTRVDTQVLELD